MFERILKASQRSAWPLMSASMVLMATGCDESTVAPPIEEDLPGAITVTTQTSGFMKDDGYELMVDGASAGSIGANDEITLPELDPATYEVALGDVAENCAVDGVTVEVAAEETAEATLSVVCAPGEGQQYAIRFNRDRPNLEDGVIAECPFGLCPSGADWDLYIYFNSGTDPHSVVRQNQADGAEIAHLPEVTLETLTEEDVAGATFTTELVADPFDSGRVILIKTDQGNIYALGNPVENTTMQTLTFDAVLLAGS
jgi:hypothetical protein